ncbi:MAG: ABC transporter ATP-binding protein/permease, partial [Gammaproteobacteria bacterium]|nr:ABC transporter ATP-binding protein/permease [Gammaproteobacteria bacterium]
MTDPSGETVTAAAETGGTAEASLLSQLDMMVRALWASPARGAIVGLTGAAVAVVVATAYGQVRLNRWNQPFYDALSRRNMREFAIQLLVFT